MSESQELMMEQFKTPEMSQADTIRHSTAHLLASAVDVLYPGTKFAIGPPIEGGFYYDMEMPEPISDADLPKIEAKMREIAKGNHKFQHYTLTRDEAMQWARDSNQPYKVELIEGFNTDTIGFYKHGDFTDMCAGPHVRYTKKLKHFKLTRLAGAYWRGDEKNTILTRTYGLSFPTKDALVEHQKMLEEAAKRAHRRLGKDLEPFQINTDHG